MKLLFPLLLATLGGCALAAPEPLVLDRSWWSEPGTLRVSLFAAEDGPFELETRDGLVPGDRRCRHARCVATFAGVRSPRRVLSRGGEGGAVDLLPCGPDPFGLCPFGRTCVDRACAPLCSPLHPEGACLEDGAVCVAGSCVYPGGEG